MTKWEKLHFAFAFFLYITMWIIAIAVLIYPTLIGLISFLLIALALAITLASFVKMWL